MHVGGDTRMATLMVRSFRRHNPEFRIVQVADPGSPRIEGIDEVFRQPPRDSNIMLFRMRCFAALPVEEPTWFLDTDMLCNRALALDGPDTGVAVCRREFHCNAPFNTRQNGVDMTEYEGRTLGSLYPYVGCATYVHRTRFWADCQADMEALDPKFHNWYGDQEALRNVVGSGRYQVSMLPESQYACLPEYAPSDDVPYIFHYKGSRKAAMFQRAAAEGLG